MKQPKKGSLAGLTAVQYEQVRRMKAANYPNWKFYDSMYRAKNEQGMVGRVLDFKTGKVLDSGEKRDILPSLPTANKKDA